MQSVYQKTTNKKREREKLLGRGVNLVMQEVRPVKYKKYKLVLVLMRGRSHTVQLFPGGSFYGLQQWAGASFIDWKVQ